MVTPANIRKAKEVEKKRGSGLVQKTFWLKQENFDLIKLIKNEKNLKANNEALNEILDEYSLDIKKRMESKNET